MGYTHYWVRKSAEFNSDCFSRVVQDFEQVVPVLEQHGIRLAGPRGEGRPKIGPEVISFNGLAKCGHDKKIEMGISWPARNAGGWVKEGDSKSPVEGDWFAGKYLKTRACGGDCSYESFVFRAKLPEGEGYFEFCKTGFRPYDVGVTAALLIAKRHLGKEILVTTDGEDEHWFDAKMLCQSVLGCQLPPPKGGGL